MTFPWEHTEACDLVKCPGHRARSRSTEPRVRKQVRHSDWLSEVVQTYSHEEARSHFMAYESACTYSNAPSVAGAYRGGEEQSPRACVAVEQCPMKACKRLSYTKKLYLIGSFITALTETSKLTLQLVRTQAWSAATDAEAAFRSSCQMPAAAGTRNSKTRTARLLQQCMQ